ncbi:MAG: HEAT repeat domain-containing protein [Bacteroidota bacterium]
MKKEEIKELMQLSIYGELSSDEQETLDAYLKRHPEMKKELQEMKKFGAFVSENTSPVTSDELLSDARTQLREALRNERRKESFTVRLGRSLSELFEPKFVLSGIGMLALGLLIGYYSFSPVNRQEQLILQPVSNTSNTVPQPSIENVRFIDSDASDGEIEFEFEAVAPMHVKGKIDDPQIQKLLTHALLNESNDGVRLSSVNAIRNQTENKTSIDPAIKDALITSLKSDKNPGVRREALRVLQQYGSDKEIRDALLYVIAKDSNSGLRVAAINALEFAKMDGTKFDETTINALKQQIKKEQNNYIRNRAVNLVKEIYQ